MSHLTVYVAACYDGDGPPQILVYEDLEKIHDAIREFIAELSNEWKVGEDYADLLMQLEEDITQGTWKGEGTIILFGEQVDEGRYNIFYPTATLMVGKAKLRMG